VDEFSRSDVSVSEEQGVYDGFFKIRQFTLSHRLFEGGWSGEVCRELFQRRDAAGVLLYDPVLDAVALVEQFRIGVYGSDTAKANNVSPWMLELVAGLIERDESPEGVVMRESVEEAGVQVQQLEPIGRYYSSPGGSNEFLYLFAGRADLSRAGGIHGLEDENEDIRVHVLTIDDLWSRLERGELITAHTLIAVQWLKLNYQRLRAMWCE